MKLTITLLAAVMFISFHTSDSPKQENPATNQKLNLFCPDPLSFPETVKTVSFKDGNNEIDKDWYSKAIEQIGKEEYNISYSEELGSYQSPNRASNIRFIYHKDGFTAKTRDNKIPLFDVNDKTIEDKDKKYEEIDDWSIDFKLSNVKRQTSDVRRETQDGKSEPSETYSTNSKHSTDFSKNELSVSGNKASIEDENIRIDYTNSKEGMRQDFIVKNRPEGEGKLKLNLSADTKLKMIVGADALMFKDRNGTDKMKYSSLKCWDANGLELRAYFEKQLQITNDKLHKEQLQITNDKLHKENTKHTIDDKNICNLKFDICNSFSIVVNDEDAVYPVTIDPLSTSPNWTGESDQASAVFGYSVSAAGDVNGDGYSDVIVGAYLYDNGQTDEGGAFVYHGSASGLSATANWIAESDQDNAQFGWSVSTAGDVNGDGYSDVIVGATSYDNGQTNEGGAFVYYGSASGLSATANWSAESDQADALFGWSVSTAVDVNGDGYSDVIAGAPYFNNGQADEGKAFVYHGSASGLSATANWTAESNQADAEFGNSVSTAGDVNGDGYSDVITGARNFDNGQADEGRAYAFYGSPSGLSPTANWTSESNQASSYFGQSVSTAGDVNGDGYSDVITGAYLYDNGQSNEGRAFVYHGSSTGLSAAANWTKESNQAGSQYGIRVSTAGDVNGDGYSDVIIGANRYENGQTDEGIAFVYHGSVSGLPVSPNWSAESNQSSANFGYSVSIAGDINGDGFSDVIVGAFQYDNGQTNEGRALVYHGSASGLSTTANETVESDEDNAYFGYSVSTAGDVNGDGYSDVIIGTPYHDWLLGKGGAFVYHGSALGLPISPNWTVESSQADPRFGSSVSTAGDVNGDGYSDVIVGAYQYENGQTSEGRAFVYHGSASGLSATANWTAESNQVGAYFGRSVSSAGDVNGDGYSDVIVGANLYDNGQTEEGGAFVYHGSPSGLSATANWTAESDQADAEFGNSVSTTGDVNGDGYSDVIVGAYFYENGQTAEGRAFVYHGSPSGLSATANWTAESDQAYAYFGSSVSTAGDVNGDGYSDVIVGAFKYDNGQTEEGGAFVYHGSASGLPAATNWTAESDQDIAHFGRSVCTAGDVNGDGYSDVIVGASEYDNGQTDEGRAFVYFGNEGTGLRSTVRQFKPGTLNIIYSGGSSGTNGQARLNIFGKSPFGRTGGRIVYEFKENGMPFSGAVITNSTSSSGSGVFTDLDFWGVDLYKGISGLQFDKLYKWRARVQYRLSTSPYQKFGPWKYYNNYVPTPQGNFRAWVGISHLSLPVIFSFSPQKGPVGTTVKIKGSGFNIVPSNNIVFFGAAMASVSAASADSITVTVPAGASYQNISVTNLEHNLTGYSSMPFIVTFPGGCKPDLATKSDFPIFGGIRKMNSGDIDGDGKPDLVVLNGISYTVSVLRNISTSGGVSFDASVSFATVYFPNSISIGDLDGDGRPDLALANLSYGSVSVLRNISTPGAVNFEPKVDFTAEMNAFSISMGDLDGDGRPDLAVANDNGGSNTFSVLRNASTPGTISFAPKIEFATSPYSSSVSIGDITGDGKPDLVVASAYYNSVYVYNNTSRLGIISFFPLGPYLCPVGSNPFSVSIGDITGDGKQDLAVANRGSNTVSVLRNTSTPSDLVGVSFAPKVDFTTEVEPVSVSIGDIDGDGKPDLFVANKSSNTVSVFRNTSTSGGVSFAAKTNFITGSYPNSVSLVEIDGDGRPDLVDANSSGSFNISVFRNLAIPSSLQTSASGNGNPIANGSVTPDTTNYTDFGNVILSLLAVRPEDSKNAIINDKKEGGISKSGIEMNAKLEEGGDAMSGSAVRTYIFKNTSTDSLSVDSIKMTGADSALFTPGALTPSGKIASGDSAGFTVTYIPVESGTDSAVVNIYSSINSGNECVQTEIYTFAVRGNAISGSSTLDISVIPEGFYNAGSDVMTGDTVTVNLRNGSSPYALEDSSKAFVDASGQGIFTFSNAVDSTPYYIEVNHRNSIETWSKTAQQFTASMLSYNFTTANTQAYGDNMIQVDASPVRYGIYSGDVNQDGVVDASDNGAIDNAASNFETGYLSTDLNGDEVIDASDAAIADNNAASFVSAVTP